MEISKLTRDGTAEPVSPDQILRARTGTGEYSLSCSGDYEQDWRLDPVDPYSAICHDHTYIYILCTIMLLVKRIHCILCTRPFTGTILVYSLYATAGK